MLSLCIFHFIFADLSSSVISDMIFSYGVVLAPQVHVVLLTCKLNMYIVDRHLGLVKISFCVALGSEWLAESGAVLHAVKCKIYAVNKKLSTCASSCLLS